MTFRRRLVLLTSLAVACTLVAGSAAVYLIVRGELRGQVDDQLRSFAGDVFIVQGKAPGPGSAGAPAKERKLFTTRVDAARSAPAPPPGDRGVSVGFATKTRVIVPRDALGGPAGFAQIVNANGKPQGPAKVKVPIDERVRAVAAGRAPAYFTDATVNGVHARVYARKAGPDVALQAVRSLEQADSTLSRLLWTLAGVCLVGVLIAVALGLLVTRRALRPVRRLTSAAEHVAETHDLSARIDARGGDELSRLADTFNTMLAALEQSAAAQRQLVADASHELRTPLTSLRTNIEVLQRSPDLPEADRQRLLRDVVAQLGELGTLVADLVDLAREDAGTVVREEVRLDELVADAIARARLHFGDQVFALEAEPCLVVADPDRLERAVANLLDNAAKWNPAGRPIAVTVRDGAVIVADHGPGIAPEDLPHVFDRFYRAPAARQLPGFGLGLAIVRQVATEHAGSVSAGRAPEGGALLRLELPSYPIPNRFSEGSQHTLA
jgi:two-component system, OmpR family, sensor histidine kinase MprB